MLRLGVLMGGVFCCSVTLRIVAAIPQPPVANTLAEFVTRNWQREDGLPDNSVKAILQTRDGYLWIGTARGLARYDGLRFTMFDRVNTRELKIDDITCLAEDSDGNLWIGTTAGLIRKSGPHFTRFVTEIEYFGSSAINALYPGRRGGIWFSVRHGLYQYTRGQFTRHGTDKPWVLRGFSSIYEDNSGVVWFGTYDGLETFNPVSGVMTSVGPAGVAPKLPVHGIAEAPGGGLWVLFFRPNDHGLLQLFRNGKWQVASESLDLNPAGVFFCATRAGDLWLPAPIDAMDRLRAGQLTRFPSRLGVAKASPRCAIEDREDNLWIGTEESGLYRWRPRNVRSYTRQDGLVHDNVWTILEGGDGSIWIGTDDGLSRHYHGSLTNFTKKEGLPRNTVRALAEDRSGRFWVGTGSGLACWNHGLFVHHHFEGEWFRGKVRALLVDRHDQLWVGSAAGLHQLRLSPGRDLSEQDNDALVIDASEVASYRTAEGLPHNDVSALLEDRSGAIWIGTSGGLCRMHDGKITSFTNISEVASSNVGVLCEDAEGALWIGNERTLHRYHNGRFTALTPREGLFDDIINSILEDDGGNLWFGGDRGIYRIAKVELNAVADQSARQVTPVVYTEADGLPSQETNGQKSQPAAWKARDGRLWFPTTKGVVVFDPQHLPDNTNPPLIVIEQVRANGQIVFKDGASLEFGVSRSGRERLKSQLDSKTETRNAELLLPPGAADVLELQYTANSFVAPDQIRFKYRLEGQEKDWVDAGPRRTAYYTNLRPGEYRFRVAAANSHGVWNETGTALALHIAPHYYQTLMFKLACVLGAALLVFGIYRWRMSELRKLQCLEQQAALTAERARIAKDLHDGLGANLTQLALLADLAEQERPDAIVGRVRTLAASSREATRSLKDFLWTTQPSDETLDGLVTRICQHAEEFLETAGIRCRFVLPVELPAHALPAAVRQNLFFVAREALNNVAKHSTAGEVTVRAFADHGTFTLEIEDDGHGFDSQPPRTGRGLANMRSRVEEAGGQFTLETRPGSGTRIVIQLPLNSLKK